MKKLYLLIITILYFYSIVGWAISNKVKSDFTSPLSNNWSVIAASGLNGKHEIFDIKNNNEHTFFYRISPGGEIGIKEHDKWEEVVIISGTLEWLDANGKTAHILRMGDYVNRPPHIKHGPFKAGNSGCLMYVKMHG